MIFSNEVSSIDQKRLFFLFNGKDHFGFVFISRRCTFSSKWHMIINFVLLLLAFSRLIWQYILFNQIEYKDVLICQRYYAEDYTFFQRSCIQISVLINPNWSVLIFLTSQYSFCFRAKVHSAYVHSLMKFEWIYDKDWSNKR